MRWLRGALVLAVTDATEDYRGDWGGKEVRVTHRATGAETAALTVVDEAALAADSKCMLGGCD